MLKRVIKPWIFRLLHLFRNRSIWSTLMVIFTFSGPFLFYTWILSVHRLSNLREILSAMHTMIMLPIVNEYPRCRAVNSTHFKCLPNTFLIGASKCGTTSLIEYLDKQPRIKLINRHITIRDHHREIHRFDRNTYVSSWKWLELAEEWASAPIVNDPNTVVIHYTPHYLYAPTVPMDMLHFYPQDDKHPIKFIVLLRNPVKRALSSYWFSRSHLFGKDKLDSGDINEFTQLAQYEIQQRQIYDNCMHTQLFGNGDENGEKFMQIKTVSNARNICFGNDMIRSPSLGQRHIDKGIYVDQLQRWFDVFPPVSGFTDIYGHAKKVLPPLNNIHAYREEKNYFLATLESLVDNETMVLGQLQSFLFQEKRNDNGKGNGNEHMFISLHLPPQRFLSHPNKRSFMHENIPSSQLMHSMRVFYAPYLRQLRYLLQKHHFLLDEKHHQKEKKILQNEDGRYVDLGLETLCQGGDV